MKYLVIVGDGMADYPLPELDQKTPLQYARTPGFDRLAAAGELGLVQTIPGQMPPGSDTANLSVLGYDPETYYTGRSPLEAASLGVELAPGDVSFRCNLVTLSSEKEYAEKTMTDYCSGEITSREAAELMALVRERYAGEEFSFHDGFNYRHLLVWHGGPDGWALTPPHDISGQAIGPYLPGGEQGRRLREMMADSYSFLAAHPVNRRRVEQNLNPANSLWIWGAGRRPQIPLFREKYGLRGAVISAVDLVKGLGVLAGLEPILVEGATGNIDTNYKGKADAAYDALLGDYDFVYLHIEAPDECSHRFERDNKIRAIELIDSKVVLPLLERLENSGEQFKVMLLTDHATPLSTGTHTRDPVPFTIYEPGKALPPRERFFDEESAAATGLVFEQGYGLMDAFIRENV